MIVSCTIAILQFAANAEGGTIQTPEDAMWWAVSTMTTVGYGDTYPVTAEGRVIAVFLMAAGVGAFGVIRARGGVVLVSNRRRNGLRLDRTQGDGDEPHGSGGASSSLGHR
jgi:voltage-gated potassium channel